MLFKISFPGGYRVGDIQNDNIDANVILEDNTVFVITLFTIQNIQSLMSSEFKEHEFYFWASDMVIVKDLSKKTIKEAVLKIIKNGDLEHIATNIGTVEKVYSSRFEEIEDESNNIN